VDREGGTKLAITGTDAREKAGFAARFTAGDFWFTAKQDKIYVNAFARPSDGVIKVKTLARGNVATKGLEARSVRLLGYRGELRWKQSSSALEVDWPTGFELGYGYCLEISR
jgi:alpha-L-fucosidase